MTNMNHMSHIREIAEEDVETIVVKEATYQGSWKKRGGIGAFMMLARKWDRIENMVAKHKFDIFDAIGDEMGGDDGTILAEIIDLRCYLLLVHAEMESRNTPPSSTEIESPFGYVEEDQSIKSVEFTRHPVSITFAEFKMIESQTIGHGKMIGEVWSKIYHDPSTDTGRREMFNQHRSMYGK